MNVIELIGELANGCIEGKWKETDTVYVDWDREGGNEQEADEVTKFDTYSGKGVRIG